MFFVLSKFLGFLLLPQGLLMILSFVIILNRKNHTKVKKISILGIFLTYIFCSTFFVKLLASFMEVPHKTLTNVEKSKFGILLTGGLVKENSSYINNIQLGGSADRMWKAVQLYKANKIDKVIVSGGDFLPKKDSENDYAKTFLILNGIPKDSILQEKRATNTYENALYTSQLLKNVQGTKNGVLITSAYHLKRANACFKKQGLRLQLYPSGQMIGTGKWNIFHLLPMAENFHKSELLIKELAGMLVYKLKGYI